MLTDFLHRLRALVRRDSLERELDEELQFHLAKEVERHQRSGLSHAEATRVARLDLGGVEQVKEACRDERGVALFEQGLQDLIYAGRALRHQPAFALTVIVTLALGIAATTTVAGIMHGVVLKPLPYRDAGRIVQLGTMFGGVSVSAVSPPDFASLARARTLESIGASSTVQIDATGGAVPEQLPGARVSASFFDVLGVSPALGAVFGADEDRENGEPVVVLSDGYWRRRFAGDARGVGSRLVLDGVPHTVIGVMPESFRGPDALGQQEAALWLPLNISRNPVRDRDNAIWSVIARLAPGATPSSASAEIEAIAQQAGHAARPGARRFWLAPLLDRTVGDAGKQLWLMLAAVGALLLIACANVASLFLARATERRREVTIRAAIGAGRGRIVRQLLTESTVLSLTGGALGAAAAFAALNAFRAYAPEDLPRVSDIAMDWRVLALSAGLSAIAGLLCGLIPALDAAHTGLAAGLRGEAHGLTAGRSRLRLRNALVVAQISLALALLVGSGLLANSLVRLGSVDPGFSVRDVIWVDINLPDRYDTSARRLVFLDTLMPRIRALPGIVSAGTISGKPLGGGNAVATMQPEEVAPTSGERVPRFPLHAVTSGYFAAMGIPLVDGRDVRDTDRATAPLVAVVSRAFAQQFWPGQRAVGKRFWVGRVAADAPLTGVIGVVEDVRQYSLASAAQPTVYLPIAREPTRRLSVMVRHDGRTPARQVLERIRREAWRLDAALPLERAGTMQAIVHASIRDARFRALALLIFAACAVAVAAVGLYGTLAWTVRARQREMGIRMVLGADRPAVRRLIVHRGMSLAMLGIALGLGIAIVTSRVLASMVYGITTTDLASYAAATGTLVIVALLACLVPARRAASTDLVVTLRMD
ncbi:MAG TPA: ABC transporter permease [Vicinamibacterales bacterium]|nr:ABC transporter permease [Vicinamibacterales bacterium]